MKNVIALVVLIASVIICSCSTTTYEKQDCLIEKITEEEALNLLHKWTNAYLSGDATPLDEVLDESWVYSGSANGSTTDKATTIDEFSNATYKFESITYEDLDVRLYEDIAVVRGSERMVIVGEDGSNPVVIKLRFTDIYQKKAGKIKAIATHSSPITD